jgi:hypothetical protein
VNVRRTVVAVAAFVVSGDAHESGRRSAVVGIQRLCRHKRSQGRIMELNPVPLLVELSSHRDTATAEAAALALCKLSGFAATRDALVDSGVAAVMIRLSRDSNPLHAMKSAKALTNFSQSDATRARLMKDGAVDALLQLSAAAGRSDATRQRCAVALCNLLCHDDMHDQIISAGALPAFDALAASPDTAIKLRFVARVSVRCRRQCRFSHCAAGAGRCQLSWDSRRARTATSLGTAGLNQSFHWPRTGISTFREGASLRCSICRGS